ncbi:GNAT family N-acetyltransferase [Pseudarthrobacter sp. P1]|uniref:GNAT family N-acetyltransferase n=1 Tax=Pseudarthrobacter sp. P1 TaxID=3418418 RepID=UPI003CF0C129
MTFTFRPVDPSADAALLHSWVTLDYARFWGMASASVAEVEREYAQIQASGHHVALLGLADGAPAFLMERYDPARSPLAGLYDARAADVGMHLLVGPPVQPRRGVHHRCHGRRAGRNLRRPCRGPRGGGARLRQRQDPWAQ